MNEEQTRTKTWCASVVAAWRDAERAQRAAYDEAVERIVAQDVPDPCSAQTGRAA